VVKTDLDKKAVDNIIKNYVDNKYPNKVKNYHKALLEKKNKLINDVSDITFIHNELMWQDSTINTKLKLNSLEFKRYCKKLDFANRKDWRVPQLSELMTLVDYTKTNSAALDKIKNINSSKYWTSSLSALEEYKYWFVDFQYGETGISSKLKKYNIRCVRDISQIEGEY